MPDDQKNFPNSYANTLDMSKVRRLSKHAEKEKAT